MKGIHIAATRWSLLAAFCVSSSVAVATAQTLTERGKITVDGHSASYVIHRLPVSSFPSIPSEVAAALNARGCVIPQTYEAHRPENVVHASLVHAASSDWAVLCSVHGTVSLLVFLQGAYEHAEVLATAPETERLQPYDPSGVLGFNWGIDRVTPRQLHDAAAGSEHRPPAIHHDALADSTIERNTVYHLYSNGAWTLLDMPN